VFRWIAFNGWMAAVTGEERDFAMIAALAVEQRMIAAYDGLMSSNEEFRALVDGFAAKWPVLSVSSVRAKFGYDAFLKYDRSALLAACATANVKMQPVAWAAESRVGSSCYASSIKCAVTFSMSRSPKRTCMIAH